MIRVIVSSAENPDDALRTVCMVTLIEIGMSLVLYCVLTEPAILDMDRLVQADAFRTILLALKDGPAELGPAITGMLIVLSNSPETREKMMPGSDVEVSSCYSRWETLVISRTACSCRPN
jgi:rapamycin-insensitive companion of mTOR